MPILRRDDRSHDEGGRGVRNRGCAPPGPTRWTSPNNPSPERYCLLRVPVGGRPLMGRSEEYRQFAEACLEMAQTAADQ